MSEGMVAADRAVLRVGGADARTFLQGLITNDIAGIDAGAVYAAMLTPQGKYLFDFILLADEDDVLLDVDAGRAAALAQRLGMYRLRADVRIEATDIAVVVGLGEAPAGAVADPRTPELGWRAYAADAAAVLEGMSPLDPGAMAALRVAHEVPQTGVELIADDSYILEMGFERLKGVDFRKGCYVGQEVTARMKHKTALRKGLAQVAIVGPTPAPGTEITADGKPVGRLHTVAKARGLAYLRFDRAEGAMKADGAAITRIE